MTIENGLNVLQQSHTWEAPNDNGKGRWEIKPRPNEWVELFDQEAEGCILCLQCLGILLEDSGCCRTCKIPHWNELVCIRKLAVQKGYKDELFHGVELPSIDTFMRNIKDEVDASWFTSDPDTEHRLIHTKFKAQASWMMVDVSRISSVYKDLLIEKGLLEKARVIRDASTIAEYRQIGSSAKKSPEDVEYWARLTSKHEGLRCGTGYDKPFNEEGFLKWMIDTCMLFDGYPDTRCMRRSEIIHYHKVRWLPVEHHLEQAMQDRAHQEAGNASARATLTQLAAHPYDMQEQKLDSRVAKQQKIRAVANYFSSLRLWRQSRVGKYRAWANHPSNHILCCNGRVIALAMRIS